VGRNTAVHEGAYARHLASKSIELALLIESALSAEMSEIGDYMVSGVVTVAPWHPVSFARQTLLANSFSFLPIWVEHKGLADWHLISDRALAKFVRNAGDAKAQVERLAMSLEVAIRGGELQLAKPLVCGPNVSVIEALEQGGDLPILVHGPQRDFLLGIATAFDLL
jgi:hypothetical protein